MGRPPRTSIEVCARCLTIIKGGDRAAQERLFGEWWWHCLNAEACSKRQQKNKARHQEEIARRLKNGRGHHTHLIVVLDQLGEMYGYGNYYVAVNPGEDPEQVAQKYRDDDVLVVQSILPIEDGD